MNTQVVRNTVITLDYHVTDPDGVTLIFVQVPESHPLRRAAPIS